MREASDRLLQLEQRMDEFGLLGSYRMVLEIRNDLVECLIRNDNEPVGFQLPRWIEAK